MRYPWLTVLIFVVALLLVFQVVIRSRRDSGGPPLWVANSALLRQLPAYRHRQVVTRFAVSFLAVFMLVSLTAAATLSGAPVDRRVDNPSLASRDLVLCLDASGSMLPYDGQILDRMRELVEQFEGERVALQLWSAQSVVKFSLTDDYELVDDVLAEAAGVIRRGYMGEEGDYVLVSAELFDYLEGVDSPDDQPIASLVGDGLASCVLSFDHHDQERSRTIILATDNEVQGPQIYTLQQAVKFAGDQSVDLVALYPAPNGVLTTEGEQLRDVVEASGGSFYQVDDAAAVQGIMLDIAAEQLVELEAESRVVETDRPRGAAAWLAVGMLGLLTVLVVRRS